MATKPMKSNTNAPGATGARNVQFVRDEVRKYGKQYDLIRDCIDGETVIKDKGAKYLPRPNPEDTTPANVARYNAYLTRAVFYNATRRTLSGLLGEVFAIDPVIEIPTGLESMRDDATGGGVTLIQQSIAACHSVLAYSRAGIFVDFPAIDAPISVDRADEFHPLVTVYEPWQIINWRTITRGSKIIFSLVVLEELYEKSDDGFEVKTDKQWRVLRLTNDVYTQEIWRGVSGVVSPPSETITPKDKNGETFKEIPFHFIGATNNDAGVDAPLLYDLASLNIAHYRNSADYEESSFITGQPMYWFAGITKDWFQNVLKGEIKSGARAAIPLPENASAGILQPDPNTMPAVGMEHKEKQMVALGAKLVENRSVQRTASEATMDQRTENSILSTAANNVSDAFTWALGWGALFMGLAIEGIAFTCNTEFAIDKLAPEDQAALVATWQAGGIAWPELRFKLRKSGIATMPDDDAESEIKADQDAKDAREIKKAKAMPQPAIAKGAGTNKTAAKKPPIRPVKKAA